ncbi:pyruvate:ferredoxin (flavodoxin) oxidoreductase [Romboutsia sp. 1001216sp1]|uniref:pyruvate:ferredoxin (flavodoxin) oxidoreductase n=1 Tax=unclassified Romboutsia TaxID=2626894 RepID=UPI0018A0996E|nr:MULTISPECIES: pyruvate:ferredoxin (flavodoxin) oxidoreductase [unclassified Romboutsia]MDB8790722.1 pyruvate:ferredoxin (flavodoxin) oxidoreductase [Romboutsia sp. 1001216sp1]MDB8794744.1 pyruvate:ferredoxin (flavodoxin) oxidoreductase [Romboutsia sp. 1001216sp1]MDB8797593.1 pyruvate:ferredoxin (flavodoxin) oxidoreductase [Romboutsia sp. 1001216sp1]MDB8800427.1 pyruvate:ferredoxin (flavodoxin) oxidoreductase [Romboutsia sp. 1001216sp1]MDB8803310.1 pyruvate:ferredoxin (flavodoxin) oxidoreduc
MGKIKKTMDGNAAAAYVSYAYTEVAAIFPITPSSNMAESVDDWSAKGLKNIFNQKVNVVEMQSEAGAAGVFHGSLQSGALTTTYTASQGLLLMIPNMYKVSGELLPGVFHVSARALAAQALSIFGDHQDVMAARQTGCVMLASGSVQEVADLAPVAHLAAIKGRLPFIHFFDGFRTSHEIQKIEVLEYSDYANLLDKKALQEFRNRALSPNHPVARGTAQNPDIYFQTREASNKYYEEIVPIVENYMNKIGELTGRQYGLFNYYGAEDAKEILIAIGSVTEAIEETIDELNAKGEKYGLVKVHLFRPFSKEHLLKVIPKSVNKICVLDRTKEPGAIGEPLYLDVRAAYYGQENAPMIIGGRYGLGSKDVTPTDIKAIFDNLVCDNPKDQFTVGIVDDVTHKSLEVKEELKVVKQGTINCKFWGLGSDGTVGANKQAIKIIGDNTDKYVQAYFAYDSKKSGGVTMSHLRFGDEPIRSTYLIDSADYIACHNQSYVTQYDLLKGLKSNGTFVLNTIWDEKELEEHLPAKMKNYLAKNNIDFYTVNATKIAQEIGLGNRINMIMQSAFFKLANIIPEEEATKYLKSSISNAYGKKGEKVVNMNYEAVEQGKSALVKINIPDSWANATDSEEHHENEPEFIREILRPMNAQEGDSLPVSAFNGIEDGTFPAGTAAYEKRGIGINVPEWILENCIQCNQCSYICPHSTIRPFLLNEEEVNNAPETFRTKKAVGKAFGGLQYRMQVDTMDCTGCGNCADICPAKDKALVMKPLDTQIDAEIPNWDYAVSKVSYKGDLVTANNVKDSQFRTPLIEFSGACAGCGETAYIKLVTQLYGDRMMIANATGCSSIWGGSAPSIPYTVNHEGKGPAWANSLFEDNAEFGYGMYLGVKQIRLKLRDLMEELVASEESNEYKDVFENWINTMNDGEASKEASKKVIEVIENKSFSGKAKELVDEIKARKDYLVKRSQWIVGGDGWAYDIDYGGLDHVLASGEDVNVLVFDTEIYSNTGGQASKSTPLSAMAKFAASGKKSKKKDLGMMAMSYGNVYVAQVSMGADKNQLIKAVMEAEKYDGPSLIIAYAPCISHGLKEGMGRSVHNEAEAVASGYWHLYRYNPELKKENKNPFNLDSKEPKGNVRDFIMGQVRYSAIAKQFPDVAEELFTQLEENIQERYETYKRLAGK